MLDFLQRVSKAFAGAVAGGLAAYSGVFPDGVTVDEWLKVAAAAAGGWLLVWAAPRNRPAA